MSIKFPPIHRVVTGHDDAGKAVVSSSGALPTVIELAAIPGVVFHEVWNTAASPAPIDGVVQKGPILGNTGERNTSTKAMEF